MSSRREMAGLIDYTGTKAGTLDIGPMIRRSPEPRYESVCRQCGAKSTASQTQIHNGSARCLASNHNKPARQRERLTDERRNAAERESERIAEDNAASARRIEAEVGDYQRPERYTPTPEPRVMTQRERDSLREFREADEAEQRAADAPRIAAEREQAQRIAELQAEQENTLRQLHTIEAERIANGRDGEFTVDPATIGESAAIPVAELDAYHAAQSTTFLAENPSYFRCPENEAAIIGYIERNAPGIKLLSATQLTAAYRRLRDFGLLKERPAPTKPIPQPQRVYVEPEPTMPIGPKTYQGRDYLTGEERAFTQREVGRMSSDEYRKAFPVIDSVRDLFSAIQNDR